MSLRPETKESLRAAAEAIALDFDCGLPHAKKALWLAVLRYMQPPGMQGDVLHSSVSPSDVDVVYLELRAEWERDPSLWARPSPAPGLSAPTRCRSCRAEIRWGQRGPKKHPYNLDGVTSHFDTCPDAARWRPKKGAA